MPRFRFECLYAGANFHGWQKQSQVRTVQDELETALNSFFGCSLKIYGAGRTDRGVNSLGLSVHFQLSPEQYDNFGLSLERWPEIINRRLPDDVRIENIRQVDENFHARHSASGRLYGYRFLPGGNKFSSLQPQAGWVCESYSYGRARRTVSLLNGQVPTELFSGSGGSNYQAENWPVSLCLRQRADEIWLLVYAPSFRYLLVRCIARAVQEVASGIWKLEDLERLLDRQNGGLAPAPPQGCFFLQAFYQNTAFEAIFLQGRQKINKYL